MYRARRLLNLCALGSAEGLKVDAAINIICDGDAVCVKELPHTTADKRNDAIDRLNKNIKDVWPVEWVDALVKRTAIEHVENRMADAML